MGTRKATAKQLLGEATGDRRVEAEGQAERKVTDANGTKHPDEAKVEAETDQIRHKHGDV